MIFFNQILEEKITPNQFYLLYAIQNQISTIHINPYHEVRTLVADEWLKDLTDAKGHKYELQPKAVSLISKISSLFGIHILKSSNQLMGNDFEVNAEKYNNIFPRMKLGSNKAARAPLKEIIVAFRWFFENYEYDWDTVLAAASFYIEGEKQKGFKYTRTSKYFIRKQDTDKAWSSELASYCELVKNGEEFDEPKFTDKVF